MKKALWILSALVVLSLGGLYVSAPLSANTLVNNAQSGGEFQSHINYPVLEANLAQGLAQRFMAEQNSPDSQAGLSGALVSSISQNLAKGLVTDTALLPVLKAAKPSGYSSLNHYQLESEVMGQPLTLTLSRTQLIRWQLTDIDGTAL